MNIKLQLANFAKLLLIGAVLFVILSAISQQAIKCVSAKNENVCQAGVTENLFARAREQVKPESPGYFLVGSACVKAITPPTVITPKVLGAIVGDAYSPEDDIKSRKAIIEYETEGDDTIASIADKFSISSESVMWANDLSKTAQLKSGQKLIIPPVSGVIHYAILGDTIAAIAQKYQVKVENIIAFNELAGENDIFIGDVLVVPEGKILPVPAKKPILKISEKLAEMPNNYFLCPVGAACKKTQGMHFRNAVDLTAGYCGAPIYAAASGIAVKTETGGWNGGAGNNITLSHFNGMVITHYYHLQSLNIIQGQEVKKGDVIGFMGSTGKSTGCHLHFEVIGAANPFN